MMVGLAVVAESLISLVLTEKWLPCVPYLRVYCFSFAFYPVHTANLQALNAQGRSDQYLKLEIIKKSYGLIVLLITVLCFDSPLAIALGGAATTMISFCVNASPNKKLLNYSYFEQMKDILPSALISIAMGFVVYCVTFLNLPSLPTLIIQIIVGIIVYPLIAWALKLECFTYIISMTKNVMNKKKA
jgi:O-antigen/teichoic acid export membrane protein